MQFKLWLEASLERDIVQTIVFDAADVAGEDALASPISIHTANLHQILNRGVIHPFRDQVKEYISKAKEETLNDLINFIVQISNNQNTETV